MNPAVGDIVAVARYSPKLGVAEGRITSIQGEWFIAMMATGTEAERNFEDEGITWARGQYSPSRGRLEGPAVDALRVSQALR